MASIYAADMAKGLFEAAQKRGEQIKWLGQLRLITDLLKDPALAEVISNKALSFKDKEETLSKRVKDLSPETLNLVQVLDQKGKLSELENISIEYQRLLDQYHGIEGSQMAEITTAVPLDDKSKLDLGRRLTEMTGRPVVIKARVDPQILGGIVIRIGDRLIDGSVRSKLQTISKELV